MILATISAWISIFYPVNPTLLLPLILILSFTAAIQFKRVKTYFSQSIYEIKRKSKIELLFVSSVILFLILVSIGDISNYDTGLYHAQAIRWISEFSVVPGLGNLHGRLAFNSHFFPVSALFSMNFGKGPFEYTSLIYPINGLCLAVLISDLISFAMNKEKKLSQDESFASLVIICNILLFLPEHINSASTDVITAILVIYAFIIYIDFLNIGNFSSLFLISGIIATGITFKLSFVFLSLLIFPFLFGEGFIKKIAIVACIFSIIIFPFLVRNYFLSGYLIYPFPDLDIFNPDWKIPLSSVVKEKQDVEAWAKMPGEHYLQAIGMPYSGWFPTWFAEFGLLTKISLILNAFLIVPLVGFVINKKWHYFYTALVLAVNLIFWFFTAPNFRFAYGFFFVGSAMTICCFLHFILKENINQSLISMAIICSCVLYKLPMIGFLANRGDALLYPIGLSSGKLKKTDNRFLCYTPTETDRCFNCPLPCTPYPKDSLVLRTGALQGGFRIKQTKRMPIH